jgi:hypothetical protein
MMGWQAVERVWLPEWLRDREAVLDRLVDAVRRARAGEAAPALVPEPTPAPAPAARLSATPTTAAATANGGPRHRPTTRAAVAQAITALGLSEAPERAVV